MKRKICVVTGSRADYGLLCWVMKEIEKSSDLSLIPVVTGAHFSKKFGSTIGEIKKDGFRNLKEIRISSDDSSAHEISKHCGEIVGKFGDFFRETEIDFLVLLGDRFEMLSVALAALPYTIPIAHIGGGEITKGAIDDSIRHSLTKLSHLHFPITKECGQRIRKMGEEAWRIKVVGSPRLDFLRNAQFKSKEQLRKEYGISFKGKTILMVYHPTTLEVKNTANYADNLLKAVELMGLETVMFYPNLDTSSDIIIDKIKIFAKRHSNVKLFKPLPRDDYLSLLKSVDVLVGNSSIGIIEAPSFRLPAVNIGNRQQGRDFLGNVVHVGYDCPSIIKGIRKCLFDRKFINSLKNLKNHFGDGRSSQRIVNVLSNINLDRSAIIKKKAL